MKKLMLTLAVLLSTLSMSNVTSASMVYSEDFEDGADGWSENVTTSFNGSTILGGYKTTGAGDDLNKVFDLSGSQSSVTISFDFIQGDSWDGESVFINFDGQLIFTDSYAVFDSNGKNKPGSENLGGNPKKVLWTDAIYHHEFTFDTTLDSILFSVTTDLNQEKDDEWFGIDNFVLTENYVFDDEMSLTSEVPAPSMFSALGLFMLGSIARKKYRNKTHL